MILALAQAALHLSQPRVPAPLELAAPIERWDEGLPLGNGMLGALVWGEGQVVRLSLDRSDLWDERVPDRHRGPDWSWTSMQRLVAAGDAREVAELFDWSYDHVPYPTKLPAGRLELRLPADCAVRSFRLDLERALATVELSRGSIEIFWSATERVGLVRVEGCEVELALQPPSGVAALGYPAARVEPIPPFGDGVRFVQSTSTDLSFAVAVASARERGATMLAIAIETDAESDSPWREASTAAARALRRGWMSNFEPHAAWWREFWSRSSVALPDARAQAQYDFVQYLHGAGSRRGAPPMPLQGVWTADEGGLPPWKGDYHNDLNTQTTYCAYAAAGLFEQGESFLDFLWERLPRFRDFAQSFYGVDGAVVPGVMTLAGRPTAGWGMYSLSPTNGAWLAQSFHQHWRVTRDRAFLAERAYPWCAAVGEALARLLQAEDGGPPRLPLSSSPEIFDNTLKAFLVPNSNYDLALLRWLTAALAEMAQELGRAEEAARWSALLARLEPLDVEPGPGSLTFARGVPVAESHRHFSHAMAIHPLGILHVEGSDADRAVIAATLARIAELGTSQWCGYSFAWFAAMNARAGRAEPALDNLEKFLRGFIGRNGFHLNGDQSGTGLSAFTYRPFTLEGNVLAMHAVHEMLLQGWGGTVRVFPAVSERWRDIAFEDLRAEGALRVSAERVGGATVRVRIVAEQGGRVRLRDPFAGREASWNRGDVARDGRDWLVELAPGAELSGSVR